MYPEAYWVWEDVRKSGGVYLGLAKLREIKG